MPDHSSTKRLFWMKNVLIDQGVSCIYLSGDAQQSQYHMRLMAWLFRHKYFSLPQRVIRYGKGSGILYFRSVMSPIDSFRGHRASIIHDHRAFEKININMYQDFLDLIKQSKRYEHP
jgi:hypothetical protein